MKKLLLLSLSFCSFAAIAQTPFWSEDFSTGCNQGTVANGFTGTNGTWTVTSSGTNDTYANEWFISAMEAFTGTNNCGDGCGSNPSLTDGTLHLSNVAVAMVSLPADNGASYNTGGLCSSFSICVITNKRAESPTIDCTGKTGITLGFSYMENGDGTNDDATLYYYDGITWSLLSNLPKTPTTCAPQGTWTAFQVALPASADNNPNVKIGFNWTNNDDGAGADPSFAVDSIRLSTPVSTGILSASAQYEVNMLYTNEGIVIDCAQPVQLVAVRDMLGREVSGSLQNRILTLNAAHGVYMTELNVNGQKVFRKVVAGW